MFSEEPITIGRTSNESNSIKTSLNPTILSFLVLPHFRFPKS